MQPLNIAQVIINAVLTIILPIFIGFACWLYRLAVQRLPEQQTTRLELFARMSVQMVEQQYKSNPNKKALAEASVAKLFQSFKLPLPAKEAIDISIESAVFDMNTIKMDK